MNLCQAESSGKTAAKIVGIAVVCIVAGIAGLIWWDWHADHRVRQWIDGSHDDVITFSECGAETDFDIAGVEPAASLLPPVQSQ